MKRKPNLFIVGAPKCGTTAWYRYLGQHPDISFAGAKEPHYFSSDFPDFRWAASGEAYAQLFESLPATRYIGEASVMYLYSEVATRRILHFNPDAKILIFIRQPAQFLPSYHAQMLLNHDENVADLEQAWGLQDERREGRQIPRSCREPKFLQYRKVASFGDQLNRIADQFPNDQFKVIVYEEWIRDPLVAYAAIMDFLELKNDGFAKFRPVNRRAADRNRLLGRWLHRPPGWVLGLSRMARCCLGVERLHLARKLRRLNRTEPESRTRLSGEFAARIRNEFAEDQRQLEQLLGREITIWNEGQKRAGLI